MLETVGSILLGGLGFLLFGFQIACIVHAWKRGRPFFWIWILFVFPVIGVVAYFLVEIRPTMGKVNWQAIRWKLASPEAKVQFRREQLERSDTLKNRYRLADELLAMGRAQEACEVLEEGKKGVFVEDPELLIKIAEAKLDCGMALEASKLLASIATTPSADFQFRVRLALARVLAETKEEGAEEALIALATPHRSEGPNYYLAKYLIESDRAVQAREVLEGIKRRFRSGTSVWRFQEQRWYQGARQLYRATRAK